MSAARDILGDTLCMDGATVVSRAHMERIACANTICRELFARLDELTGDLEADQLRDVLDELSVRTEARLARLEREEETARREAVREAQEGGEQ